MAHAGGRPPLYTSVEEVQVKIDAYFKECDTPKAVCDDKGNPMFDKKGNPIVWFRPKTMSGLANALGMDRRSLLNYSKDDKFFPAIARARDIVQQFFEESLFDRDKTNGAKFALTCNFDNWQEKQVVDATLNGSLTVTDADREMLKNIAERTPKSE